MTRGRCFAVAAFVVALVGLPALGNAATLPQALQPVLQIEPARLEVVAQPGQKYTGKFAVTNTGSSAISVRFSSSDRRIHPGGRVEVVRATWLPTSAAQWMTLSQFEQPLGPKERKEFEWGLALPAEGIGPGDYAAVLFVETVPRGPAAITPVERVGALVVVNVAGATLSQGKVVQLSYPPERITLLPKGLPRIPSLEIALPSWLRRPQPLPVSFSFVNEGSARVRAVASLVVASGGRTLLTVPAGVAEEVFPGDAADFRAIWPNPPLFGTFDVIARVDVGGPRPAEDGFVVHVFPWPLALASTVPLGGLVALAIWHRRRRMAKEFDDFDYLADEGSPVSPAPNRTSRTAEWAFTPPPSRRLTRRRSAGLATPPPLPDPAEEPPPSEDGNGFIPTPAELPPPEPADPMVVTRLATRSPEVERLLGAGLAAMQLDAYSEAYQYFAAAVARDGSCVEGWLLRAGTAESTEDAENCLHRALSLDPDNAWATEGLRLLEERATSG